MRIRDVAMALLGACALTVAPVGMGAAVADDRSDLVEASKQKQEEIEQAQKQLEGVNAEIQKAYMDMLSTEQQIADSLIELKDAQDSLAVAERQAEAVTNQLEAARGELARIKEEITSGRQKIEDARDSLGVVARAQYRGDTTPSTMELLVGSATVTEFLNSFATSEAITRTQTASLTQVEQVTARNETRAVRQTDVEAQIVELKEEADRLVAERTAKEEAAELKKNTLEALQRSLEAKSREFQAFSADLQGKIAKAGSERAAMLAQIAAIDEANRRAALARAQAGSDSFISPMVPGATVVSEFGWRIHPIYGVPRLHKGIDFAVGCGVPQQAPADATIQSVVYNDPGGGNYIIFDLGTVNGHSWQVWSLHMISGSIVVSPGQKVKKGQIVGLTGMTGSATGCHVHQEVWMDGQPINPRVVM